VWVSLIALAGLPAVLGTWIGAYAFVPHWSALFLGLGAGGIPSDSIDAIAADLNELASR